MAIIEVVYGLGGYDPTKPNDNILEIIEDQETDNNSTPPITEESVE
jgi:hypothetical protein